MNRNITNRLIEDEIVAIIRNIDFNAIEIKNKIELYDMHLLFDCDHLFGAVGAKFVKNDDETHHYILWDGKGEAYMYEPFQQWKTRMKELDLGISIPFLTK